VKQDSNVNEEWKSMFGSLEPPNIPQALPKTSDHEVVQPGKPPRSESSAGICVPLSTSPQVLTVTWAVVILTSEFYSAVLYVKDCVL
jgi:phosphoinositide-3-kinase regulatory subunit 4